MGSKKHKKHKSEKKERHEDRHYGIEKPPGLKIILKVGSSSTPEHSDSPGPAANVNYSVAASAVDEESRLSASPQRLGEDRHLEKHKKSKKKKKKKEREKEKHEKKHKHHHKEKRKRDRDESNDDVSFAEESLSEPPVAKKVLLLEDIKPPSNSSLSGGECTLGREPRSCVLRQRLEKGPLQKLLDFLLKGLEKKDPQQYFAWPVTDNFAPGYSQIITQPMDFSTMKQRIDDNHYGTLQEFVDDFKLMCNNCMVYNHPETVYYKAARKLLHVGLKMVGQEKLRSLYGSLPVIGELGPEELGFEIRGDEDGCDSGGGGTDEQGESRREMRRRRRISKYDSYLEDLTAEEILEQAKKAAKEAADRLTLRRPNSKLGFLRQKKDGTTSLAILNPGEGVLPGTQERPISLGLLTGKITHGTGQLQGFREDRRNICKTVKPLYYGAFGSYAPSHDSTFSNLTKEETDLVYATYGDETSVQYAESILDFARDCDVTLSMVDNLLNILTEGEHGKTMHILDENRRLRGEDERVRHFPDGDNSNKENQLQQQVPVTQQQSSEPKIDLDSLRTLSDIGIDIKFLETFEQQEPTPSVQSQLDQTSELIGQLNKVQHERLSATPPAHLAYLPSPSDTEMQLAEKITENLKDMTKQVAPEHVAPVPAIRKALGISLDPVSMGGTAATARTPLADSSPLTSSPAEVDVEGTSSADLESELREFLENEPALSNSPLHNDPTLDDIFSES